MSELIYGIIYKATLKLDGRLYIGQTVKHLAKRIAEHKHASKNPKYDYFHSAIKKYGIENFEWEILKECYSKKELDEEEDKFIIFYETRNLDKGFNLKGGGSYGKHSEETKKIISEGKIAEKNGMFGKDPWNKGKNLTDEHKNKIKTKFKKGQVPWNKDKKGTYSTGKRSEETKKKISNGKKGEKNPHSKLNWEKVEEIRRLAKEGMMLKDIALIFKVSAAHVSDIINNKVWRNND